MLTSVLDAREDVVHSLLTVMLKMPKMPGKVAKMPRLPKEASTLVVA